MERFRGQIWQRRAGQQRERCKRSPCPWLVVLSLRCFRVARHLCAHTCIKTATSECFKACRPVKTFHLLTIRSFRTYLSGLAAHLIGFRLNWHSHHPTLPTEHNHPGAAKSDTCENRQWSSATTFRKTSRRNVPRNSNIGSNRWREAIFRESGGFYQSVFTNFHFRVTQRADESTMKT